ncbi:MAG: CDP-alcohol phosphatidyltransferase family protein [Candidatus Faecousia sp.]|nr:CDP-alcohol phosphatidyltransferase family protein [Clostridiales bacterium]MDY6181140.1 CDP-alcohol phosphatidyltransferase family protein [Candidatus Faecousia sp.]
MYIKDWKKEVFTIPNLLSLFRLALIPVYITVYLNAEEDWQYYVAGAILAVSCMTDLIDGKIARRFHMISTVGKVLDPLADKATQFTLTLCLSVHYPVLRPVLVLFVIKEGFQLIMGIIHFRKGKMLPGALMAGKICTTILFVSLIALVLFPGIPHSAVNAIALVDTGFLIFSFISYILAYFGKNIKVQDMDT